MEKQTSTIRTLNRVCDIVNLISESQDALTLSEISRQIHLPKSTTFRFVEAMTNAGLLTFRVDLHGYVPGYQLIRWGKLAEERLDIRNLALPLMRRLTNLTGESSILSIRDGNWGLWLDQVESSKPVRLVSRAGKRLMLHAGASSKVLLAFLPEDELMRVIDRIELVPLARNSITRRDLLLQELESIRKRGYATSIEETDEDAIGIAAPVFDRSHYPIAGIGIYAPLSRVPEDQFPRFAKFVLETCNELSNLLGANLGIHQATVSLSNKVNTP